MNFYVNYVTWNMLGWDDCLYGVWLSCRTNLRARPSQWDDGLYVVWLSCRTSLRARPYLRAAYDCLQYTKTEGLEHVSHVSIHLNRQKGRGPHWRKEIDRRGGAPLKEGYCKNERYMYSNNMWSVNSEGNWNVPGYSDACNTHEGCQYLQVLR